MPEKENEDSGLIERVRLKIQVLDKEPECPECEKLHAVHEQSQVIGEFLEWLHSSGIMLAHWRGERLNPVNTSIEKMLAKYFEIDLDKVEQERRLLLARQRC